ncbi:sulfatase [Aquisphaera insulae]|uniref:sulfatase n=1 Tax=Aquisphaera insulae TaxID=2712864 RepID=UPI0013ED55CA|nr:sulfatase [Aquisphaera insulae]
MGLHQSALEIVTLAAWAGIGLGLIELSAKAVAIHGLGRLTYETLRMNRHYAWMIPLSNLLLFTAVGMGLALTTPLLPARWRARTHLGTLGLLAAFVLMGELPNLHLIAQLALAATGACLAIRRLGPRGPQIRRLARRTLPAGLLVVAGLAAWPLIRVEPLRPKVAAGMPNVVLITMDTVRADALTPYGSPRDTTPNLARLARRGVLFENAWSTAPWTLPSHASLFTGRWSHEHSANVGQALDATHRTLAEHFADLGYDTAGFVANMENCNAWYGLDRGFDRYEDFYENGHVTPLEVLRASRLGRLIMTSRTGSWLIRQLVTPSAYMYRKSADMLNRDALAWLDAEGREGRPFFLFLNYFDAHSPYVPPGGAPRPFSAATDPNRRLPDRARDAYDDCLAYLDDRLGRLMDELGRRGLLANSIVVITADHGEAFGEHGLMGHGISLYRHELHIPLLVIAPGRVPEGRAVRGTASLCDIAPTLTTLAGPAAPSRFSGRSLDVLWSADSSNASAFAKVDDPGDIAADAILCEVDRADRMPARLEHVPARRGVMRSLIAGPWNYIRNGDDREELYHLEADPDQQDDLAHDTDAQDELAAFRATLDRMTGEDDGR